MTELVFNNGTLRIPVIPAVSSEQMVENMRSVLARDLPQVRRLKPHGYTLSVASGGPSLEDTWDRLEGHVAAVNGSLAFLLARGLVPHFCGVMDAHPRLADIVVADPRVIYIVASTCHPALFDKLLAAGCPVHVWHPTPDAIGTMDGDALLRTRFDDPLRIGGGCTIGLRWITLGHVFGYRRFHLHGLDSSFRDRRTHAYDDRRSGDWVDGSSLEIAGRRTSLNFLAQVTSFGQVIDRFGDAIAVDVMGDGLLQDCWRQWQGPNVVCGTGRSATETFARLLGQEHPSETAANARAEAILSRLPAGDVRGAEVGVFGGALSKRLLRRPDLHLVMVDSWEGDGAAYHDKGDWHATLSQATQDGYYWAALSNTDAMRERRTVLRKRSTEAAHDVADGSLDFVFLDADHSAEGLTADIAAWVPKLKPGGLLAGHDYGNPLFPDVAPTVGSHAMALGLSVETGKDFTWFAR